MYDVIIVGAGVNGCATARELSKYELKVLVLERALDVCEGTSKANSGIVHAGYDAKPGTLKAKLNVRGSKMMNHLAKELNFEYRKSGSLVVCFDEDDVPKLEELMKRGIANGVEELKVISGEEVVSIEPNLSSEVKGALYAPGAAIVDPFGLTVAMAENAAYNGVEFKFGSCVDNIKKNSEGFIVEVTSESTRVEYRSKTVINCAGVYADRIHNMVSKNSISIIPRRGEYMLLDTTAGTFVNRTIFQLPTSMGKGVLITPTVHGNLLVGPTATDIEDKEDTQTTAADLSVVKTKSVITAPDLPLKEVITSFSGLRAKLKDSEDFLINECEDVKGFIDVAGMESPGLSCAPATAEYVVQILKDTNILEFVSKKEIKIYERKYARNFAEASYEKRQTMVEENPLYGNIVCRCRNVTEGEIVDAIHSVIPATTADGIKRRTKASMGRCQAGFCNPRIVEILSRELGVPISKIAKSNPGSEFVAFEGDRNKWYMI